MMKWKLLIVFCYYLSFNNAFPDEDSTLWKQQFGVEYDSSQRSECYDSSGKPQVQ